MRRLLLTATVLSALTLSSQARIGLVTIPARQDIRIKIDRNNNALVQERRDITVKQGANRIEFSWPNMAIDFNTVQLIPLEKQDSISILSVAVPPNANNTLVLDVESRDPNEIPFRITYLTGGLSWQSDYIAVADVDEQFLTLDANVTITNGAVEDYHDAEFELPVGKPFRQFLQSGESKKITLFTAERIPVTKTYTSDPREHGEAVAMHYVFHNDAEHGLDQGMLLPGRVRQFKKDAMGSVAFLGEDVLSFVPAGDEIKLYQGPARRGPGITWLDRYLPVELMPGLDVAISAAGYNSYHELMMAGVPTIFLPQPRISDDQEERARRADAAGAGAADTDADSADAEQPESTATSEDTVTFHEAGD